MASFRANKISKHQKDIDCLAKCAYCLRSPGDTLDFSGGSARRTLRKCTRCMSVAYCNRKCQSKHYAVHKQTCWKMARKIKNKLKSIEDTKKADKQVKIEDSEYKKVERKKIAKMKVDAQVDIQADRNERTKKKNKKVKINENKGGGILEEVRGKSAPEVRVPFVGSTNNKGKTQNIFEHLLSFSDEEDTYLKDSLEVKEDMSIKNQVWDEERYIKDEIVTKAMSVEKHKKDGEDASRFTKRESLNFNDLPRKLDINISKLGNKKGGEENMIVDKNEIDSNFAPEEVTGMSLTHGKIPPGLVDNNDEIQSLPKHIPSLNDEKAGLYNDQPSRKTTTLFGKKISDDRNSKSSDRIYKRLGKALSNPCDINSVKSIQLTPKTKHFVPRTELVSPMRGLIPITSMDTQMVLHCDQFDERLNKYMGVYNPTIREIDKITYELCPHESFLLLNFYNKNVTVRDHLINRGIYLSETPEESKSLSIVFRSDGDSIFLFDGDSRINAPTLWSPDGFRLRQIEIWNNSGFLYHEPSEAFFIAVGDGEIVQLAITPISMFKRAIELSKISLSNSNNPLLVPKATDFSFWNTDMVLHTTCNSCDGIDAYMGVYKPLKVSNLLEYYGGYPVWVQDKKDSDALARSMSNHEFKDILRSRGIFLKCLSDNKYPDKGSLCIYMHHNQFHLSHLDDYTYSNTEKPVLRSISKLENEAELLTKSEALFDLGEKAFGSWLWFNEDSCEVIKIAMTPEVFFRHTISLADLEHSLLQHGNDNNLNEKSSRSKGKSRCKKKRTKKNKEAFQQLKEGMEMRDSQLQKSKQTDGINASETNVKQHDKITAGVVVANDSETFYYALSICAQLCKTLKIKMNNSDVTEIVPVDDQSISAMAHFLFDTTSKSPAWLLLNESITAPIFRAIVQASNEIVGDVLKEWIKSSADALLRLANDKGRRQDIVGLIQACITVSAEVLCQIFEKLPKERGNQLNNKIARDISTNCRISLKSKDEVSSVMEVISSRIGKQMRSCIFSLLKKEVNEMVAFKRRSKKIAAEAKVAHDISNTSVCDKKNANSVLNHIVQQTANTVEESPILKGQGVAGLIQRIDASLIWYSNLLEQYKMAHVSNISDFHGKDGNLYESSSTTKKKVEQLSNNTSKNISPDEAGIELAKCTKLPLDKQKEIIRNIEMGIDISDWNFESEWTIDVTEQAHKWFRRHAKREHSLCDRVIRRLKLLSTGRWPYVLCKPLKTRKKIARLYESKVDCGSRIIWEVAISFSQRRSSAENSYCEQVIRVWDIIEDHDNLSRGIERTVERIEKSHLRGRECVLYSELVGYGNVTKNSSSGNHLVVPRVFPMQQAITNINTNPEFSIQQQDKHFPPASDDPHQFTLLKFYELNANAVALILGTKDEIVDLPFTPGPKEHEIIHYASNPPQSILLMGRSGTGKTTCLVFRMWAQYMAYIDSSNGMQPRQLFITKNDILRREVEKSFHNMGLAWSSRIPSTSSNISITKDLTPKLNESGSKETLIFPLFLTAHEWLDVLDEKLPGTCFFSPREMEHRSSCQNKDDTVKRSIEAFLAGGDDKQRVHTSNCIRALMNFKGFRESWAKINSRLRSSLDPALVWLEIKSHIKGSVAALKVNQTERSLPQNRFLSLQEYLALPRKQSRINTAIRKKVYDLYISYEKFKKDGNYFDEMDVVYNLAGRISLFESELEKESSTCYQGLLPIDSLFVDEIQDFTQAELYILAKLSRDPNNLFMAGDSAQSISQGVGFRFTDVRQIFYESFGGIEPKLLQLTHNYRSHAGILHLAATVVELLYFFFSDSLDKLPPDLGLFDGPKPVILDAASSEDLVLMLDGSKRETSRIEFGAHQVVIVRSEETKENLPSSFGVDKDWVMTVQESKGLEFDDVLIYNFFTDSDAGNLWRIVSNYTEDDISAYYGQTLVTQSGVKTYEWEDILTSRTRPLEFNHEEHKVLEIELKMLYTAITRARVNVFFAETDTEASLPMFNYFKCRNVVDTGGEGEKKGVSDLRVFGKMNTSDEWMQRGEYYLQNAEGERGKGCLRLAAKCFDKAGNIKRRDYALAYLAFEEQDASTINWRTKQGIEQKYQYYKIAAQLLEAKDIGFLNKAALCLMKLGEHEDICASIFEIYALLQNVTRRSRVGLVNNRLSLHEQEYFSYAAKLFERCSRSNNQEMLSAQRQTFIIRAFQNYVRSGIPSDFQNASRLIKENSAHLKKRFVDLYTLCSPCNAVTNDPITVFQSKFCNDHKDCACIAQAIDKLAKISCRSFHSENDSDGLSTAIKAIISPKERIRVLSSIDIDAIGFISRTPWASHTAFSCSDAAKWERISASETQLDLTKILVEELTADGQQDKVGKVLEDRGLLLEAAAHISSQIEANTVSSAKRGNLSKIAELKARYIELLINSNQEGKYNRTISSLIGSLNKGTSDNYPYNVKVRVCLANAILSHQEDDMWRALEICNRSVLWRYTWTMQMIYSMGLVNFLKKSPGVDLWYQVSFIIRLAWDMQQAAKVLLRLSRHNNEENTLVSDIEAYFCLEKSQFDPSQLTTNCVTNIRIREALLSEGAALPIPLSSVSSKLLIQLVDKEKIYAIIAQYMTRKSISLCADIEGCLSNLENMTKCCLPSLHDRNCKLGCKHEHLHSSRIGSIITRNAILQSHLFCLEEMRKQSDICIKLPPLKKISCEQRKKNATNSGKGIKISEELVKHLVETNVYLKIEPDDNVISTQSDCIIWRQSVIDQLIKFSNKRWNHLSMRDKKENLGEIINHWKVLNFCDKSKDATEILDAKIQCCESHASIKTDWMKRRHDHFLRSTMKFHQSKLISVKLLSRMWIWAVESVVKGNLFNSITLIERLLCKFKKLNGRENILTKTEQISLLEVSAVSIISTLFLRYSEVPELPNFIGMIPERSYLKYFLNGDELSSRPRGLGIALKGCLIDNCHKKFFDCFKRVVAHLEFIAGFIVDNMLLAPPIKTCPEDIIRFERAICLSSFVCCNAVTIAISGTDMTPQDAEEDVNRLPKLPLNGRIRILVKNLREGILKGSDHVYKVFEHTMDQNSSFLDLLNATDAFLQKWEQDRVVLYHLRQCNEDLIIETSEIKHLAAVLNQYTFHENSSIFINDHPKSHLFLKMSMTCSTENSHQNDMLETEVKELSRTSDEKKAAFIITHLYQKINPEMQLNSMSYFQRWKQIMENFVRKLRTKTHFQRWKQTLEDFISIARAKIRTKVQLPQRDVGQLLHAYRFGSIKNLWNDLRRTNEICMKWKHELEVYGPWFDGIACGFCSVVNNNQIYNERINWCYQCGQDLHWKQSILEFNYQRFNCPIPLQDYFFFEHRRSELHTQNVSSYDAHILAISRLACRLETSHEMILHMIYICDQQSTSDSWYLNTGEEGRSRIDEIRYALHHVREQASWPPKQDYKECFDNWARIALVSQQFYTNNIWGESQRMKEYE